MATRQQFDHNASEQYCYLTTKGRVSGRPHEIEIWFALSDGTLYMLSGNRDRSDWVRNLANHSAVNVRIAGQTYSGTASTIETSSEEDSLARDLLFEKYQPDYEGDLTEWRQTALPVAVKFDFSETDGRT